MAATDDVKVKVTVDNSQAERALNQTSKSFKSFGEKARDFAVGAGLISGGLTSFVKSAIDGAARAEQLKVAFTTMIGDAEKATATLKSLETFAQTTPFQLNEVQDAAKKLLAFGTAADQIEPTLRKLGDISAGVGAPIAEIAELYGKAQVQGRLFAEDINQLTGRGIPIITALAETMGTTESNVKKLVESGKVGFPELQAAITSLTDEGSKFGGLMAAQAETFGGKISNIQDNFNKLLTSLGEQLLPVAKQVADSFGGMVAAFNSLDPETKETIAQAIALAAGLAALVAGVSALIAIFNPLTLAVVAIVAVFVLWKTKGEEILNFFIYWGGEIGKAIGNAAQFIWDKINWLSEQVTATWTWLWDNCRVVFETGWEMLKAIFGPQIDALAGLFKFFTQDLKSNWGGTWEGIKSILISAWNAIKGFTEGTLKAIIGVIEQSYKNITETFNNIKNTIVGIWQGFWDQMKSVVDSVVGAIQGTINNIKNAIENVIQGLVTLINKAKEAAQSVGGFIFGGARAEGGPVTKGSTYLVGENGPEYFTPSTTGSIIPNHKINNGGGGSSVVININGIVSSRDVAEQYADQIVRKLQLSSAIA